MYFSGFAKNAIRQTTVEFGRPRRLTNIQTLPYTKHFTEVGALKQNAKVLLLTHFPYHVCKWFNNISMLMPEAVVDSFVPHITSLLAVFTRNHLNQLASQLAWAYDDHYSVHD